MFYERLQSLCIANGTDVSNALRSIGLSTSKGTAWKGGAIPKGDVLLKLANRFNVSTDYLLGNTDDPTPAEQKEKPPHEAEAMDPYKRALIEFAETASENEKILALEVINVIIKQRRQKEE